jgi:hypothetical protein
MIVELLLLLLLLLPAGLRVQTAHASSVSADVNIIAGAQVIFVWPGTRASLLTLLSSHNSNAFRSRRSHRISSPVIPRAPRAQCTFFDGTIQQLLGGVNRFPESAIEIVVVASLDGFWQRMVLWMRSASALAVKSTRRAPRE